jgi:hypothetical protein
VARGSDAVRQDLPELCQGVARPALEVIRERVAEGQRRRGQLGFRVIAGQCRARAEPVGVLVARVEPARFESEVVNERAEVNLSARAGQPVLLLNPEQRRGGSLSQALPAEGAGKLPVEVARCVHPRKLTLTLRVALGPASRGAVDRDAGFRLSALQAARAA